MILSFPNSEFDPGRISHGFLGRRFDSFIPGTNNRAAWIAVHEMVSKPVDSGHNPLIIYGNTGVGKAHLMIAAGNALLGRKPQASVVFAGAWEMVRWASSDSRGLSNTHPQMFLMPSAQFLCGKESAANKITGLLSCLRESGVQIIVSCSRPPRELEFSSRLGAFLGQGIAIEIGEPEFQTRVGIAFAKASERDMWLPADCAFMLAKLCRGSVRILESAICLLDILCRNRPLRLQDVIETARKLRQ